MIWKIIQKKLLFDKFIRFWNIKLHFQKFDTKQSELCDWYFIEKKEAVGLILFDPKLQKVLLVKQFRLMAEFFPDDLSMQWPLEIIAGTTNEGEDPKQAICREAYEEIRLKIVNPQKLFSVYPSPGIYGERLTLFYDIFDSQKFIPQISGLRKENEDIMPIVLDLPQLLPMINKGIISDAKTTLSLLWLAHNKSHINK